MQPGIIASFCILLLLAPAPAWSQDIVREDGAGGAFTSIQAAINGGASGVISVEQTYTGTLDEAISVTRSATIRNDTGGNVVLTSSTSHVIDIEADVAVTIQRFEIADGAGTGVRVSTSNADVTVEDCYIHDNDGYGIADWDSIQSAEVLVDSSPGELFPDEPTIESITTTVTLSRCTIESGSPEGLAIAEFFGTLNIIDCPNVSATAGLSDASSDFGVDRSVITLGAGDMFIINSSIRLVGEHDGIVLYVLGYGSYLSDGDPARRLYDYVRIDRSLLLLDTDTTVNANLLLISGLPVSNRFIKAQTGVTNSIFDMNGLGDGNSDGLFVHESLCYMNHCTILGANNGDQRGGRRGITCNSSTDQELLVTNSLFGNWVSNPFGNDVWDNNAAVADYCHLWNNGADIGNIGNGYVQNITYDDSPFLNEKYEITVENPKFTDSALSDFTQAPDMVHNDFDEINVRPRGAANDKGAQEGLQPTPTETPYVPAGVQTWEVYR